MRLRLWSQKWEKFREGRQVSQGFGSHVSGVGGGLCRAGDSSAVMDPSCADCGSSDTNLHVQLHGIELHTRIECARGPDIALQRCKM